MSSQERSTSPISLEDEVSWSPQESTVYSPVSNNEINNEPDNEINDEANNEHLHTTEFLNHDRKKRRMIKTTKPSAFSTPIQINSSRTNASFTRFFFEDDKKDDQIKYCKICVKEYEGTRTKLYPYSKSGGSTGHLTHHLRERHNITANNYKEHLDSSQEPIVKVNLITNYITNLPPLSTKRQNELTKVLIEFIVCDIQPLYILQDPSFRRLLLEFQPQYRIPCASTVKKHISETYSKEIDRLREILANTATIEGLKQIKHIHQRLKNIQTFFRLPKQAQRLKEMQVRHASTESQNIDNNDEIVNPLEILTDCRTRWNSAYLAWKRILELYPAMRSLAASLQFKPDTISKKEGEKLDQLCLTLEEKKFVEEVVDVLKPFEEITRHFSGSKYPTINLIYPYIRMLKNKYAPRVENGESFEKWIALIYGSLPENSEQISENLSDDDTSVSSGDEANIPSAGTRQQWQYAHRSIHSRGRGRGCRSGKHKRRVKSVAELDDTNNIKYLPPTKCEGLLEKMRAAIYLSLDELWSIPDEIGLKASMLDPRVLKLLPFATEDERRNTEAQIRAELSILEAQFRQNNDKIEACITTEEEEYDSLSAELWGSLSTPTPQTITEDELTKYLKEQIAHKSQDPLIWWKEQLDKFYKSIILIKLSQLSRLLPYEA
ncbi:6231_t:CDS:2 [Cetraspora pellucida]|uniref:6231_t:CDS:1 n=1 Tax=Cetraspora pellucida TaxID=1433469 RepID=A0ACA9K4I8_9GLOM|nr:6231_t:CDS:2 [Cetraspora pellucida]